MLCDDLDHFKINKNQLGNKLFNHYSNIEIEKMELQKGETEIFQFNLNDKNHDMYWKVLQEHEMETEAEYFRSIIFDYLNRPKYKREKILYENNLDIIIQGIKENKKLNIKYKNEIRTVNPYFLKVGDNESSNYLFCYCEVNNDYRNYRICNLEDIYISKLNMDYKDEDYINEIRKNFDPFLSYKKKIKVKLSSKGKKMLEINYHNRPKLLKSDGNNYLFECSIAQGKLYFSNFLSEIEIVEPIKLREWFKDQFLLCKKLYD